jgi:hypothetical protein
MKVKLIKSFFFFYQKYAFHLSRNGHVLPTMGSSCYQFALFSEMNKIADGVEFDTIAREWRCKWSPDGNKASLVACQMALESVVEDLNDVDGVKSIERIVCGDCLDFKVITSVSVDNFDKWKKEKFDPEEIFVEMLGVIDGVSQIETQTYTVSSSYQYSYFYLATA